MTPQIGDSKACSDLLVATIDRNKYYVIIKEI